MTLAEWLDDQRRQALTRMEFRGVADAQYWRGYADALQDVANYVA